MNTFTLDAADPEVLIHHLAFYGLADILGDHGVTNLRMRWDGACPVIEGDGLTPEWIDQAVREHARARRPWVERSIGKERRGVMSPRLSSLADETAWTELHNGRHQVLDALVEHHGWSDLRYLAALGEPAHWSHDPRGAPLQDDGASRWEMQPRNRGSEFVGNRLRPLATTLLARQPGAVVSGLEGATLVDELGGKPDSVSATGLNTPGPVDNALVWCALWGIGWFPTSPRINSAARSSGHFGRSRHEWFYLPYWTTALRPARVRSLLAAEQLRVAAASGLGPHAADVLTTRAALGWLQVRHVTGILRFPIGRFGSDNAPERRALRAEPVPVGNTP